MSDEKLTNVSVFVGVRGTHLPRSYALSFFFNQLSKQLLFN